VSRRSLPRFAIVVILTALSITAPTVAVTTLYVDDDACPAPGTGAQLDPYCAIQTAIDATVDTDTILVAPGTYFEKINFNGKTITLKSTAGPNQTTIDAAGLNDSVVKCINNETPNTILQGFTITGGTGRYNRKLWMTC
jgi:hypothetical protein